MVRARVDVPHAISAPLESVGRGSEEGLPMKLLVVEDDKKIAMAVKRGLENEGFTVEVVFDGLEGVWRASEGNYDLIVLDIMLPGRNGFQICADLRAAGNWTPILMLTAKDGDLDEAEALDAGADDYLTKPFSFAVLVARVRSVLRRGAGRSAPVPLEAGDLRIDPRARRAWRGDREIALTSRQFEVLEFLLRRAGAVLSKRDILDGVWRHDFDGDPNIVEVYVSRLRAAIDEPFGRRAIETVRGAGYRLATDGG
jgi:two-component system, OmpR family, response regulator